MNSKNDRQARVCECGAQFLTTEKFGNETKCDACYEAGKAEYLAAFSTFSPELKREHLAFALSFLAKAILEKQQATPEPVNPEEVPADDQDCIDDAFNDLMGSVNWGEA